jgi:hypothetical protein
MQIGTELAICPTSSMTSSSIRRIAGAARTCACSRATAASVAKAERPTRGVVSADVRRGHRTTSTPSGFWRDVSGTAKRSRPLRRGAPASAARAAAASALCRKLASSRIRSSGPRTPAQRSEWAGVEVNRAAASASVSIRAESSVTAITSSTSTARKRARASSTKPRVDGVPRRSPVHHGLSFLPNERRLFRQIPRASSMPFLSAVHKGQRPSATWQQRRSRVLPWTKLKKCPGYDTRQ